MVACVVFRTFGRQGVLFLRECGKRFNVGGLHFEVRVRCRWRSRPSSTTRDKDQGNRQGNRTEAYTAHATTPGFVNRRINRTVVPFFSSLSIQIRPPCASTTFLAKARPK